MKPQTNELTHDDVSLIVGALSAALDDIIGAEHADTLNTNVIIAGPARRVIAAIERLKSATAAAFSRNELITPASLADRGFERLGHIGEPFMHRLMIDAGPGRVVYAIGEFYGDCIDITIARGDVADYNDWLTDGAVESWRIDGVTTNGELDDVIAVAGSFGRIQHEYHDDAVEFDDYIGDIEPDPATELTDDDDDEDPASW